MENNCYCMKCRKFYTSMERYTMLCEECTDKLEKTLQPDNQGKEINQ